MGIIQFAAEHTTLFVFIVIVIAGVILFVFRVEGFASLLGKAFGTVLQQVCSLILESVFLIFKILNALEIYIVLMIDALTGKAASKQKIPLMAIGALSIASFYTTYKGMRFFISEDASLIAFLITLGIQALLFSTSLQISDNIDLQGNSDRKQTLRRVGAWFCVGGCIAAYILNLLGWSYTWKKNLYHILYLIVILSVLAIVYSLVRELVVIGDQVKKAPVILMVIYFTVMCVSSFFSYNAFVSVMYPDDIREIDSFQRVRIEAVTLLERADAAIDDEFYQQIKPELIRELNDLENATNNFDVSTLLNGREAELYSKANQFKNYQRDLDELERCRGEETKENSRWEREERNLSGNPTGLGAQTRAAIESQGKKHDETLAQIRDDIQKLENKVNGYDEYIKNHVTEYQQLEKDLASSRNVDCRGEIDTVRQLLQKKSLTDAENRQLEYALDKIEQVSVMLDAQSTENNLSDMAFLYRAYQEYQNTYTVKKNEILQTWAVEGDYGDAYERIQSACHAVLNSIPDTAQTYLDAHGNTVRTSRLNVSNYFNTLETVIRNENSDISMIEKNIRTFLNNKLVGVCCALLAVIIDMMILFVGIILPKDIDFFGGLESQYSEAEIKRILSNLFNKPVKR